MIKYFPNLGYWQQYASEAGPIQSHTQDATAMRSFLNAEYLGTTASGKLAFDPTSGVDFDLAKSLSHTTVMSEDELDYYGKEYLRNGLEGPCTCKSFDS